MRYFLALSLILSFANLFWLQWNAATRESEAAELYRLEFCLKVASGEWPDYDAVSGGICPEMSKKP